MARLLQETGAWGDLPNACGVPAEPHLRELCRARTARHRLPRKASALVRLGRASDAGERERGDVPRELLGALARAEEARTQPLDRTAREEIEHALAHHAHGRAQRGVALHALAGQAGHHG